MNEKSRQMGMTDQVTGQIVRMMRTYDQRGNLIDELPVDTSCDVVMIIPDSVIRFIEGTDAK